MGYVACLRGVFGSGGSHIGGVDRVFLDYQEPRVVDSQRFLVELDEMWLYSESTLTLKGKRLRVKLVFEIECIELFWSDDE